MRKKPGRRMSHGLLLMSFMHDVTFTTRLNFVKLKFNLLEKKIVTECKIKVNIELNSG